MFIRETKTKNKKTGNVYITHKLVENYRAEKGVRQRVIMSLGTLVLPKSQWKELAYLLETRITGQKSFLEEDLELVKVADEVLKHNNFIKKQKEENGVLKNNADMQSIDLNTVSNSFSRSIGAELIANTFWEELDFDKILDDCGFNEKQRSLAKAVIIGRLINPQSELGTWRWFQNNTALIEMTDVDLSGVGKNSFYEIGDQLFENKEKVEKALFSNEQKIFKLTNRVYLYDLTNTYFEGSAKNNSKAKFGLSKEKRSDCPLVTLALVVDSLGFPVHSQIYEGGKSEPQTFIDVLNKLNTDISDLIADEKPILIMDRGIATKDNIALIVENGYPYTVINRRQSEKDFENEFAIIKEFMISNQAEKQIIPEGWEVADKEKTVYIKKNSG